MLLSLKSLVQVDLTGNYFWLTDQTGKYDAALNPGGWGGPNPDLAKSALIVVAKRKDSFLEFVTSQILYSATYANDFQAQWQIKYLKDGWQKFWLIRLWVTNNGVVDISGGQVFSAGDLFYIPAQPGKVWMKTGSGPSAFIEITDFDELTDTSDSANAQVFSEGLFAQSIERKRNDLYKKVLSAQLKDDSDTASKCQSDIDDIRTRLNSASFAFKSNLKDQANDIIDSLIDDYHINYSALLVPVSSAPITPYSPFLLAPDTIPGNFPGGLPNQFLQKKTVTNFDTQWVFLTLAMISDVLISPSVLNGLPAQIVSEAAARTAADSVLQTNINNEASARATAIAGEASSRANADNAEAITRANSDNSEAATRAAADTALSTLISNEATARAAAVSAEAAARSAADALRLLLAGGTMTGAIAMSAHKITGLTNGSASDDAAAFGQIPVLPAGTVLVTNNKGGAGGDPDLLTVPGIYAVNPTAGTPNFPGGDTTTTHQYIIITALTGTGGQLRQLAYGVVSGLWYTRLYTGSWSAW